MSLGGNSDGKMWKYNADYVSTSKVELDTFSIHWSIQNFSELTNNVEFHSPIYLGGPKTNHSWQLSVEPNTLNAQDPDDKKKYLAVYLILTNTREPMSYETSVKATFKISLLNKAGEPAITRGSIIDVPSVFAAGESGGFPTFRVMSSLDSAWMLFDNRLTVHCRVWIQHDFEHSTVPGGQAPLSVTKKALEDRVVKQLRLDFKNGFETGALTDMTLVTKTRTFKTHKFVLAARSPVFKVMLSSEMKEATQNSVEIPDFDDETVESMLQFVYSGEVTEVSMDQACDLLRMADKYEMLGLKEYLEEVVSDILDTSKQACLDTSNVLKVLAIAEMHGALQLKKTALRFTNKYKGILRQTADFKELVRKYPNLIYELYDLD